VTVNAVPTVDVSAEAEGVLTCEVETIRLTSEVGPEAARISYQWSYVDENGVSSLVGDATGALDVDKAGKYTLTVTDLDTGCTADDSVEITRDDSLPDAVIADPGSSCLAEGGSIELSSEGSTVSTSAKEVEYSWRDADGNVLGTSATYAAVAPGTYTLTVTDTSTLCHASASVTVNAVPTVAVTASAAELTCDIETVTLKGSVGAGTSGGAISYSWTDAEGEEVGRGEDLVVEDAGTYTLTVTVAGSAVSACSGTAQVVVDSEVELPDAVEIIAVGPTCAVSTGSVRVVGAPIAGLTYVLVDTVTGAENLLVASASDTEIVFSGLPAGKYVARVQSSTNVACVSGDSGPVTLSVAPGAPLAVNLEGVDPATCGLSGTITVTDPNGFEDGTFEYVLVDAATGEELSVQKTTVFSGVGAGRYFVRVRLTGDTGCVSPLGAEVVLHASTVPPFAVTLRPVQPSCGIPGSITVTDQNTAGPGTFEYVLVDADTDETLYAQASPEFKNVGAGRYTVRVRSTTDGGCISQASAIVTINGGADTADWSISCPVPITLECGENLDVSNTGQPIIESNCDQLATSFTYTDSELVGGCTPSTGSFIRTFIVEDSEGSIKSCSQTITIVDTARPVFENSLPVDIYVSCENPPEPIAPTVNDGCGGEIHIDYQEYRKDIETGCATNSLIERVWTATDGCGNQSSFTQKVHIRCPLKVYNGISINGDGLNDTFIIEGIECYPDNTVKIFNRWGVLVFETENYNNNSNSFVGFSHGRVTIGQSEKLPMGTYFYLIAYRTMTANGLETIDASGYLYLH
jgi:gliding motility-associated-like protein